MNQRGVVLITCYIVIAVLAALGVAFLIRSISERSVATRYSDSTQALWLAEAGVNQALFQLKDDFENTNAVPTTPLAGSGDFSASMVSASGNTSRIVTATGFVPSAAAPVVTRVVEATLVKYIPPGFYDYAIYAGGDVDIGSNATVDGNAIAGGDIDGSVASGNTKSPNDPTLHSNGLPLLSFNRLKQLSAAQGWYNPVTHTTNFPDETDGFWNAPGIPNVVFVDGDYTLSGGKQKNCGFLVVGGNAVFDATITGNAGIIGCIYTRGDIEFKGGGGPKVINLDGGVWAGGNVTITGNEEIDFDLPKGHGADYMAAIRALNINADVQVTSWRET